MYFRLVSNTVIIIHFQDVMTVTVFFLETRLLIEVYNYDNNIAFQFALPPLYNLTIEFYNN